MSAVYEYHEYANIFPMISPDEASALAENIKANGLNDTITLFDGKILDGRNRYEACRSAGVEPRFEEFDGDDDQALELVKSRNLCRRQLTSSQRAVCAAGHKKRLAANADKRKKAGVRTDSSNLPEFVPEGSGKRERESSVQAAKTFGTNEKYVQDAEKIAEASPETAERVKRGEITIPQAKRELGLDAKKPTGQCRVDGVLQPDTPEIAKMRKKGQIAEGVIPDITSANPDAETVEDVKEDREERAAIKDDASDEDWVAKLPLFSVLKGKPLSTFVDDALFYRHSQKARESFKKKITELLNKARHTGTYGHRIRAVLRVANPGEWVRCPEPKYDGCSGVGTTPIGDCHKCFGRGYLVQT